MKFKELPIEWQEQLTHDRKRLAGRNINTNYAIVCYNATGTRYFRARRVQRAWNDDKGNSMPFGGGSYWTVAYGAVQFKACRNCMGEREYELCDGERYTSSANGTVIPARVATKKEVLEILKAIGIF